MQTMTEQQLRQELARVREENVRLQARLDAITERNSIKSPISPATLAAVQANSALWLRRYLVADAHMKLLLHIALRLAAHGAALEAKQQQARRRRDLDAGYIEFLEAKHS